MPAPINPRPIATAHAEAPQSTRAIDVGYRVDNILAKKRAGPHDRRLAEVPTPYFEHSVAWRNEWLPILY